MSARCPVLHAGGVEHGEAQVFADVHCPANQRVMVEARWPDGRAATALTICREDTRVNLSLRRR